MWEQIRANRIKSTGLVIGMACLLFIIGYFVGILVLGSPLAGLIIALIIWIIMTLVAYYQGNSIFLSISKAKKISHKDHPQLFNIVEEMKIASGLPVMPEIYIIDDPAPNAFATGRDPQHAAVAVTSGLLQRLNRDELQGVIAHEMSHIKNRDVLLMMMSGVMMGSIIILADIALWYLILGGGRSGRRSSSSGGGGQAQLIILVVGIVFIILAPILAQLLYFAISRKREYMADASAALFTRYPEGLASALEKISSSPAKLASANRTTAPMYIINPLKRKGKKASDLTSTHPPISERIRILRSMGGGSSLLDYESAFEQAHKGGGRIMPASALAGVSPLTAREPGAAVEPSKIDRARETSDLMWKLNQYSSLTCACGTKFKIPPKFKAATIKCPHCGVINHIPGR